MDCSLFVEFLSRVTDNAVLLLQTSSKNLKDKKYKGCDRRSFIKSQLFRNRHPRPHHKTRRRSRAHGTSGKVGFELATDGIQFYDVTN